jgi:hypothetical protein
MLWAWDTRFLNKKWRAQNNGFYSKCRVQCWKSRPNWSYSNIVCQKFNILSCNYSGCVLAYFTLALMWLILTPKQEHVSSKKPLVKNRVFFCVPHFIKLRWLPKWHYLDWCAIVVTIQIEYIILASIVFQKRDGGNLGFKNICLCFAWKRCDNI